MQAHEYNMTIHMALKEGKMETFLVAETLIIELLLIVSLVAIVVRRLRVPYTVALVLAGLAITVQQPLAIKLTPELILAIFMPPLLFEAAFHLDLDELRHNLLPIVTLAAPGVLVTTLVIGGITALGTGMPLAVAMVFGALLSATDPVSVVAFFRQLGAPRQLASIVEGESLFNDGTAVVVFRIALVIAVSGQFNLAGSVTNFVWLAAGGLVVGSLMGWLVSKLIARVDDYLIETTLTTILAYGAYLAAERLHASGVLAVVAAGLVNGNIGPAGMSPTTRIVIFNFWEYVAFVANSLVFLLIGLDINVHRLAANWNAIVWAIVAVLVSRAVVVYGLAWIVHRIDRSAPAPYRHVLFWGGLRGAVSLALVLSLSADFPQRDLLAVMAFGVVLFTLLAQGTTMQFLLKRLGLVGRTTLQLEYERNQARVLAARAAFRRLEQLHNDGAFSAHTWQELVPQLEYYGRQVATDLQNLVKREPTLRSREMLLARREMLRAQRSAVTTLLRDGVISDEVYGEMIHQIDAGLVELERMEEGGLPFSETPTPTSGETSTAD
jgi:CPA1 family monovalent cation:H+ antiporter